MYSGIYNTSNMVIIILFVHCQIGYSKTGNDIHHQDISEIITNSLSKNRFF